MVEAADLTNCDREPIHIPGTIQPHGAMLVLDPATFKVLYASDNAAAATGHDAVLPGTELAAITGDTVAHDIRNAAAKAGGSEIAGIVLNVRLPTISYPVDLVVHRHKGYAFVEIEPSHGEGPAGEGALDTTQTLIRRIGLETDMESIARSGARLIRAFLGYDRVMVYKFLHNGAGRVVAEAKRAGLNSFMGQHFPASDIPYQARRLYLLNTIRMIGDAAYAPIALMPPLAPGEAPVDMSFAQLRSVSPIHCEYLRNMGVRASLSISIVVDGELWGLISCHHYEPKIVPLPLRIGAELFGQYFSLQISVAERRAQIVASNLARERLDKIVGGLSSDGSLAVNLREHLPEFASLVECDGAALWHDGEWTAFGTTPPHSAADTLVTLVTQQAKTGVWHTPELRTMLNPTEYGTAVAGVLAIPLSSVPRDYLLLFRSEEAHNVEWAGEPGKKAVATADGIRLSPRGSFNTWREDVRGRSRPWTDPELAVAEAIRTYLRDIVLRHNEITAEERARAEKRRRVLNDELNHRVKNIIALVKSIALQTGAHATSVADYSTSLEGRLRALAFAHDQSLAGAGAGNLTTLVEAEASLHRYGATPDRVIVSGPGLKLDDRTFGVLALVVHEMMTNAAKYGALSVPEGRLMISWALDEAGNCNLHWDEAGGPTLAEPFHEGFGSKLIRSTITYDLGGAVDITYAPTGMRARLTIPASHVSEAESAVAPKPDIVRVGSTLVGLSILVVEDQALIALDTEETLRRLGATDIRLTPNVAEAELAITTFEPDVAVLDFNLGGETSENIADRLLGQRIPFVFSTGYGDNVMIPERFRHVPVVRKPVNGTTLALQIELVRAAFAAS
jgi:light-regulated signal transduction histidine kinase (bacteriophytochrome)/CheY-like chemotaxis protein